MDIHLAAATASNTEMRFLVHVLLDTNVILYLLFLISNKSARRSMESSGVAFAIQAKRFIDT